MANVFFKRGLSSALPTASANIIDGAFYLTTDTNRLYVGKRNAADTGNVLVELNQSINIVNSVGDLPTNTTTQTAGQFYYVKGANILCVYSPKGTDPETYEWKQINPDTAINPDPQNVDVTADGTNNTVTATSTVTDTAATPHSSVGVFNFKGDSNLNVTKETVNGVDYIKFSPNIGNITSNVNTTYTIGTTAHTGGGADINLTSSDDPDPVVDTVSIVGSGAASVSQANDVITVTVADPVLRPELSFDANGALTVDGTVAGVSSSPVSGANIVTPTIVLDSTEEESNSGYVFANGTATLPVYTKSEVDDAIEDAIRVADAMTYKGAVGSGGTSAAQIADAQDKLNPANGAVGDTYKVANDLTSVTVGAGTADEQTITAKAGDLIIASGSDGHVVWEVIDAGNDQVIGVTKVTNNVGIEINDHNTELGGMTIAAGTHIGVSGSASGNHVTVTVAQAQDYTAQKLSAAGTGDTITPTTVTQASAGETPTAVTVLTGIETDAYGNVVNGSITAKTVTLTDTHNYLSDMEVTGSASNNNATITMTVNDHDNHNATGTFSLKSSSLTITTDSTNSNEIIANLVWGTF